LAAVTIRAVTGDKITHYAVEGAKDYKIEQNREQILLLLESIKLENILQKRETTLTNIAEEMDKENWVNEAFANIDTGITNDDVIVKTKDGYVFQVYYDEKNGQQFIEYLGRDDKLQIPNLLASYDKENENINVKASCEGGIEKIELIYEGNVVNTIKDGEDASFKIVEAGWYTVKVTAKNGKLRYAVVKASNALDAPTFEVIEGTKGIEDWYGTDVKVRINAKGATKIRYKITGAMELGNTEINGSTVEVTISQDGESVITAYAIDEEGKEAEKAEEITIKIDKSEPSKAEIKVTNAEDEKIQVTAEGEDEYSGIASYTFQKSTISSTTGFDEGEKVETSEKSKEYEYTGLNGKTTYWLRVVVTDKVGKEKTSEAVEQKTKGLEIGDYVSYEAPSTNNIFRSQAEYSGYDRDPNNKQYKDYLPTTELKWRILSKSENKLELISERGDDNQFYLRGYQGYNNGVALLNNACNQMYTNKELGAISARNLKIEDIEAHYTGTMASQTEHTPPGTYYPNIFAQEEGGNIDDKEYGSLGRSKMPKSGLNSEGYIIQEGKKQASALKGKYTYYTFTMTADNMNKSGEDGNLYTSLFSHKSNTYQWLASRCVYYDSSHVYFHVFNVYRSGIGAGVLYNSYDSANDYCCVLRPVVTIDLKTVKLEGEGTADSPYTITKR